MRQDRQRLLRLEDLFDEWKVFGPALPGIATLLFATTAAGFVVRGLLRLFSPGGVGFSRLRLGLPAEQQLKLLRTQCLAAFAEDAPNQ